MPAFGALHPSANVISFYLLDRLKPLAYAAIHFFIEGHVAQTPYKAPFGSLECSENIHPRVLYRFLEKIEHQLKHRGATEILMRNPPRAYAPEKWSMVETFLLNQKYTVAEAEVGTVLPVTGNAFIERIRPAEKLRGRQGRDAGFVFKNLTMNRLDEVFHFISTCHLGKGYRLPITQAELERTVRSFPDRYVLFAILHEERIIAAAVGIRITKGILYNFLVNHEKVFNHLSPPVLLMEGIYNFCCEHAIRLMDLGTSALRGKPNFTLLDFKLHMGGVATSKLSFHKKTG